MEYYDSLSKIITTLERIKKGFEEARQSGLAGQVLSAEILDTLLRMRIISSPSCLVYSPLLVQYLTDCTETVDVIHSKQQEQMWWKDSLWGRLTRFLRPRTSFEEATNGLAGLLTPLQLTFKAMQTTYEVRSKLIRRIEIKVEEHITKLEKDPSLARSVIRVAGMTGDDICQTLRHAQKALSFTGSRYDLEVRYLMLKIDILKQELAQKDPYSQNPPPYDARHPKNYTLMSSVGDEDDSEPADLFLKLTQFLRFMKPGNRRLDPDGEYLKSVIAALLEMDLLEEATQISLWDVQILRDQPSNQVPFTKSLLRYSSLLIQVRKYVEALAAIEECVGILLDNVDSQQSDSRANVILALELKLIALEELKRQEEQIKPLEELIRLYREKIPPRESALAHSLLRLATLFKESQRLEDALETSEESVYIYRRLARHQPSLHVSDFALSLNVMASSLGGLRRYRDALKILGESLQLYWNLTDDQCPLRIRLLAYSHMNRSAYLAELGHHGGALESSEISVDLYRKLVQNASEPAHIHRYFAISLVGMASSLNKVGRYKDAMDAYTESISIYRNPFQGDPAQLSSELASSLEGLAWSLHKLEDHQAALSHVEEGLQLLPRSGKGRIRSACLKTRAVCLSHLNRHQQAKKAFLDSMDILRSLHGEKPEEYVSFMAEYALEYSRILLRKGDSDEAKTTAKESVSRYRLLARDEDSVYNSGLKEALEHLSNIQAEEARKTLEESFKFN